jgi:hypothetical protein
MSLHSDTLSNCKPASVLSGEAKNTHFIVFRWRLEPVNNRTRDFQWRLEPMINRTQDFQWRIEPMINRTQYF